MRRQAMLAAQARHEQYVRNMNENQAAIAAFSAEIEQLDKRADTLVILNITVSVE